MILHYVLLLCNAAIALVSLLEMALSEMLGSGNVAGES